MRLLSDFSPEGDGIPHPGDARLLALGETAWGEALAQAGSDPAAASARQWGAAPAGRALLAAIFGNSPYLTGIAIREWGYLTRLVEAGPDILVAEIIADADRPADPAEDRPALLRRLRRAKRRMALVAAAAELAGIWSLEQQMDGLSRFAEAAIGAGLRHLLAAAARAGRIAPAVAEEAGCGFFVLGMGKLGGGELNYSSDIDLIALYDPQRAQVNVPDGVQAFFVRLVRELARILDERTGEGYVFRTDLRLRPDPASTPLAISTAAALAYYESVGQNWERAALIKARAVAGDRLAAARFLRELQPFLWRKSLDFAAIADIHSIKRQINAHRGGARIAIAGHNIKTGRGGIREIEFFAQTQQLIWGGRMPELRLAPTCEALRRLAALGRIDRESADALIEDYRFLRRVEHRLQMIDDAQTHTLPADDAGIARLAAFLGYPDAAGFTAELRARLGSVERHYAELFEEAPSLAGPGNLVFTGAEDDPDTLASLGSLGFAEPSAVAAMVRSWHHGRLRATRSARAREILTELVPGLLRVFGATPHPDLALQRFDQFLSHLPAGVQLFSLFHANPPLLELVADIMAEAPSLAERLAQRPRLLDPVLSEDFAAPLPDRALLSVDLARGVAGARDFEETLEGLRRWAGERRFQVGVQLLRRRTGPFEAGAALADIAEATLAALVPAVEEEFARLYGRVEGGQFAVVGMGRLGSREMTLASDLDLILIYDAPPASEGSHGGRPLPTAQYYARLGQRLIGALTAAGGEGRLYAVDMRLRPSGASGPLASSFEGFGRYQRENAWTWEHMALTRARPLAGNAALCRRIAAAIAEILAAPRDPERLLLDVADMRRRIAAENRNPSPWDIKNREGGLIDLEFIAQYLMLREAARDARVLRRGTAEALAALEAAGVLPAAAARELGDALLSLRRAHGLLVLLVDAPTALPEPVQGSLARLAGAVDFARLDADISDSAARVAIWFERLIGEPARHAARRAAPRQERRRNGRSTRG
ncbi:MAG TPA: bifunctional [glutamine synthetase] adenylyltransferase/[glutamine synthetase]-adenylyl-L-tyrosine phosphorylase [Stellaceae bacterium]|nr:bifunctional [glutamine synthetase] adenylyltransferase/[glutamine synthetase]-adenylyl-L-tyrosine phosphorylase [Stellaceae bacterium]